MLYASETKETQPVKLNGNNATPLTVESVDNHVYFYADVDSDRCLAAMKTIHEIDNRLRNERLSRSLPDSYPHTPIWLHIHSYGGSLFAGLGIADRLKTVATPIYSIVEGVCASAGTLISMACSRRYITPNSFMLIHQLRSFMWGTHEEFKDELVVQEKAMDMLVEFYKAHSSLKRKKIREMLKRDTWLNARECLEYGMVDEIVNAGGK